MKHMEEQELSLSKVKPKPMSRISSSASAADSIADLTIIPTPVPPVVPKLTPTPFPLPSSAPSLAYVTSPASSSVDCGVPCYPLLVPQRYVLCNNTGENLRAGQLATDEVLPIRPRQALPYTWRSHRSKQVSPFFLYFSFYERGMFADRGESVYLGKLPLIHIVKI